MIKHTLLLISSILLLLTVSAQKQIENPSFEVWEEIRRGVDEPVNWSSIKSTDASTFLAKQAPQVWDQSKDAYYGSYSLELYNVSKMGRVATGTMTNGRVHSSMTVGESYIYTDTLHNRWNTRLTARPDSIIGWYKFSPEGGDKARVKAIMHMGHFQTPESDKNGEKIAEAFAYLPSREQNTWKRFSIPFKYKSDKTPEYILIILNSGDGNKAVDGSKAFFDHLELIYNQ